MEAATSSLFDGRIRVTTSAGVPINGGKVRIYNANTVNLTTVYSDAALSVPLANPVVAASDGWCPQVFAAEGTTVDMQTETAGGVVLKTYEDASFIGAQTGTFTRDFTTSRGAMRGSGGVTYFEAGDPTGDDTGGKGRNGGWNGSQADTWYIDAAAIDTSGTFTENTKKLLGVVNTPRTTFSALSSIPIALPDSPTGIQAWRVDVLWINSASSVTLTGTMSNDNGVNYKTGASDYTFTTFTAGSSAVATTVNDTGDPAMKFNPTEAMNNGAGWLTLEIYTAADAAGSFPTMISGVLRSLGTTAQNIVLSQNTFLASFGRPTHVKLILSTGNATGFYRVSTLRGFGAD